MKFTWFHLMPWPHMPDDFRQKHRSVWVDLPSRMYEPELGHIAYHQYLDQLEYAEQVGFDGIGVNEHHANAYGLMPSPNIMAATLTRRTSKAAIGRAGQLDRALQSAAARGRGVRHARRAVGRPAGRGLPGRHLDGHQLRLRHHPRADPREIRRGARPDPQGVGGRRAVRLQRPLHQAALRQLLAQADPEAAPPIFIPGGGSVETYDFCIDNTYSYSYLSYSGYLRAKLLMEGYWKRVAERKVDESPYRAGFAQVICVADTDAEAERLYGPHVNYFYNRCLHVYPGFADAPGYRTIKTIQTGALSQFTQAAARDYPNMTWKDLVDGRYVVAGSPETVRQQMEELIKTLRVGNIFCLMHVGNMPNDKVRHSTRLFAEKVMPHLRNLWPEWKNHDDRFWMHPMNEPVPLSSCRGWPGAN